MIAAEATRFVLYLQFPLQSASITLMVPMWATILLIGLLGYLLNVLFLLVERRVLAWHRGWRASSPL